MKTLVQLQAELHELEATPAERYQESLHERMRILSRLQAAPGQPDRALIKAFLNFKGWSDGEPEMWALYALPKDEADFKALQEIIRTFEHSMRQGEQV